MSKKKLLSFLFIAIKVYGELSLDKLNQEIMKNYHFKVNISLHLYVILRGILEQLYLSTKKIEYLRIIS